MKTIQKKDDSREDSEVPYQYYHEVSSELKYIEGSPSLHGYDTNKFI